LVSELTPDRQRAFIASLRNQSYSDGYIRRVLQIGQAALNRTLREGEIAIAPKVLVGEAPEGEARERILSMKEAATLLSGPRHRCLLHRSEPVRGPVADHIRNEAC
jgi:hypothetical protein